MTVFDSGTRWINATHGTLWEQELSSQTIFYFEFRNDDIDSNGDDIDEISVDVKVHEDSDWVEIHNQYDMGGAFPVAADEQVTIKIIIETVFAVRFTVASSENNGQNARMLGWYNAA